MLVQSTKSFGVDRLKMLIIGPPGVGKTSLAKTISEPTLVISAEAGLLVLKDNDIPTVDLTTDDNKKLIAKEDRIARLGQVYQYLNTEEAKAKFKWIFIDSLTEIAQNLVESLQKKYPDKRESMNLWGDYTKEMRGLIKAFRDLPYYNVVFTALSEKEKDENGQFITGISMSGKIAQQLPGFFDEVFYYQVIKGQDGVDTRKLLTCSTDSVVAKDRSGNLNKLEEPNISAITSKIRGVKA